MSFQNQNEQKPDPTLERSAKYISNYLKFQLKEDIAEVLKPLCESINTIANAIYRGKDGN